MGTIKSGSVEALKMLRALPRISLSNIRNTGAPKKHKRGRGQYGGDYHGDGNKGSGQRQNHMRLGYETGNNPFYLRFPYEPYYQGHHMKKQYPPLSLLQLQKMIDTNRIDITKPVDLAAICNTGLYTFQPDQRCFGVHLTDEGADSFKAKLNIEVQWANEGTIAAIERNGGVISTAYYDMHSLWLIRDPQQFFKKGGPIPRRMMPSQDVIMYYSDPANRGYLADPEKIAFERLSLSQKFGYKHTPLSEVDPMFNILMERKDPRQIFYGLEPGWIINLIDKVIYKPKNEYLEKFYKS